MNNYNLSEKQITKKSIFYTIIIFLFVVLIALNFGLIASILQKNKEIEFYKEESLREGICLWTDCKYNPNHSENESGWEASICYVYDTLQEKIIEIDVFNEVLHCKIEIGDTILYVVNMEYTDADFINVIKE